MSQDNTEDMIVVSIDPKRLGLILELLLSEQLKMTAMGRDRKSQRAHYEAKSTEYAGTITALEDQLVNHSVVEVLGKA